MAHVNPVILNLHNGGVGSGQYYAHVGNPPVHPGSTHSQMPQYYVLPDQRRIEHVPRPLNLSPPYESIPAITFSVNGWAGVRVKDIMKKTAIVDAPHDLVFAQHGWRATVMNLEWPGYDHNIPGNPMNKRFDVCVNGIHMTRQALAEEICRRLSECHKVICRYPVAPGCEKWEMTAGPEGIRVFDVVLFSIHYYRTVWVPEFYVIE